LLRTIAGEKPVVVVSDEPRAHARIDRFARGDASASRWLVAVNMVSEGVDVPRLVLAAAQARVNRAMGVRRRTEAGEAQLDDGLAFVRSELAKLTRDYPEQAERLRIPASVEATAERAGVATGES